jgi:hypothetical protein
LEVILNQEFKNDIVKIVIDKLLIGILILIIGLYGNSLLEKYKSAQSFNTDISKIQAKKIGEVWECLYTFEASTDKWVQQILKIEMESVDIKTRNMRLISEMTIPIKENDKLREVLLKKVNSNRFWIGENQYDSIMDYTNFLIDYMAAYANKDPEKLKSINKKRNEKRINIQSIRNQLLEGKI